MRLGDGWVVVASRGGDPQHPAWFLNLRDRPDVEVRIAGGPRVPMRARVLPDAERAEVWPRVTAVAPYYAAYQRRTSRVIPVVVLEPGGRGAGAGAAEAPPRRRRRD
jgi:deazaflavin-dependent oxidoreductase (nitroreductase family)